LNKQAHTQGGEGNAAARTRDPESGGDHGHYHSPEAKKKQLNRISKAAGHLQHVKAMIAEDEDCADVLIQLAAVEAALHSLGKEIINEHMTHCIIHAIENGDMASVEEFQKAIKKFL
jgi:DNA-binding FrmR family transcriptional regulator